MTVSTTIDAGVWLSKYLEGAGGDHDLARAMLAAIADRCPSTIDPFYGLNALSLGRHP